MDKTQHKKNVRTNSFVEAAVRDHYSKRPQEEKHLDFDSWVKLQFLRIEKEEEIEDKKRNFRSFKHIETISNEIKKVLPKKNVEFFKNKKIPDNIKRLSTKQLLSMRYSYEVEDRDDIYAELANRDHIPNKAEGKKLRQEAAKRKK